MAKKNAILKAMIESVIYEIMVKTNVENIYMPDDTTTLAAKISEMITAINERAKTSDVETMVSEAVDSLIDSAPGTYDTFKEIATYITEHEEVVTTLNSAIGNKLDKSVYEAFKATLGSLATKSTVSESDLDASLKEKVNAAAEGNHSHSNKALLDSYTQTNANLADAVSKRHEHSNKAVLDGITSGNVTSWNSKARVIVSETQPSDLTENDLLIQLI